MSALTLVNLDVVPRAAKLVATMNVFGFRRLTSGVAIATIFVAASAFASPGQEFGAEAKLSLSQARRIALAAYPGKVVSQELEKEAGGSGLRYSFVIGHDQSQHEVGVDAKTGTVLENSAEGPGD